LWCSAQEKFPDRLISGEGEVGREAERGTLVVSTQPPLAGLYDCFLSSASNAVFNFNPYFQMCGEVKPKLFGFSLSPAAVRFNAGATRSNFAGSVTFSPSYIIQNALICAQSAGTVCYPVYPGFDETTLGFALGIPDPAPIFLGGLKGDLVPAEDARVQQDAGLGAGPVAPLVGAQT
jgi:hypothetical protein